jgi:hypothetical protein
MSKQYVATGLVYGKLWGGGNGAYPVRQLVADTKNLLLKEAKEALKGGSLDSGMGFESLKGAMLYIKEIETITVNNKIYRREDIEYVFIGNLTESEQGFLLDCES